MKPDPSSPGPLDTEFDDTKYWLKEVIDTITMNASQPGFRQALTEWLKEIGL